MSKQTEAFFAVTAAASDWTPDVPTEGDPDSLHPVWRERNPHYALTETQYFCFHVPEANITALLYLWHHPNLGVVAAGPLVFQGIKRDQFRAEIYDYRSWMSDAVLPSDFSKVAFESGYTIEKVGDGFRTSYRDPATGNSFDVRHEPASQRVFWPGGKHFEQVMRTSGEVVLGGQRHAVNGFGIRDRSWGEARMEARVDMPPPAWITATFSEDFAFHLTAVDHPDLAPIWAGKMEIAPADVLKFGWLINGGRPVAIVSARKKTHYEPDSLIPTKVELELVDQQSRAFAVTGTTRAATPFSPSPNVRAIICLMEWRCGDAVGYGEVQDVQWPGFVQLCG